MNSCTSPVRPNARDKGWHFALLILKLMTLVFTKNSIWLLAAFSRGASVLKSILIDLTFCWLLGLLLLLTIWSKLGLCHCSLPWHSLIIFCFCCSRIFDVEHNLCWGEGFVVVSRGRAHSSSAIMDGRNPSISCIFLVVMHNREAKLLYLGSHRRGLSTKRTVHTFSISCLPEA